MSNRLKPTKLSSLAGMLMSAALLLTVGPAQAASQIVTPSPATLSGVAGEQVTVDVLYSTFPAGEKGNGLGIRVFWDSSQLALNDIVNLYTTGLLQASSATQSDDQDLDGDPATDRYRLLAWLDWNPADGLWPPLNESQLRLFTLRYTLQADYADAMPRFRAVSTTPGAVFVEGGGSIDIQSADLNGDGVIEPLVDGILLARYLFGFRDAQLLAGITLAVEVTAETLLADLETAIATGRFDANGDGQTNGFTDGVLFIRYLMGLRGSELVDGVADVGDAGAIEAFLSALTGETI